MRKRNPRGKKVVTRIGEIPETGKDDLETRRQARLSVNTRRIRRENAPEKHLGVRPRTNTAGKYFKARKRRKGGKVNSYGHHSERTKQSIRKLRKIHRQAYRLEYREHGADQ